MSEWGPFEGLDNLTHDQLRQHLHALQMVIASAPVPIAIAHDAECRFISANRALASLLRLPVDSNISLTPGSGQPPYRIQQDGKDVPAADLPMQYAIAHRQAVTSAIEIVRADGTVLYVQNDVQPLFDSEGHIHGCVSVCVDMTERRLAEIGLREADRRKDEFLATLSHELRNPLAPIRTAIEIMRRSHGDADVIERARSTLERQVFHLTRITDDLLDVARITQNKIDLKRERLDLRSVLQSAIEATRPLLITRTQSLSLELPHEPLWAHGDFTRLTQAFTNLLNNAVKYTEGGDQIRVSGKAAGDVSVIAVADTGAGIPPAMLNRIFDMFMQVQAYRDRSQGGLGIGLTLAKRLIDLHGGSIEATSEGPGAGSCFIVRIPRALDVEAETTRLEYAGAAPSACRVLVADDNADAAEMLRIMLELSGHEVRVAPDGVQAVALAELFDPHIAFLDIGMPRMDGYQAAQAIRRSLGRRIMLVALTGWGQDEDKRRSTEAGFDHHLTKPPEPERLEQLISECSTTRRGQSS